jgi:queuine/archaeosine tRNA-ribosyltransferase
MRKMFLDTGIVRKRKTARVCIINLNRTRLHRPECLLVPPTPLAHQKMQTRDMAQQTGVHCVTANPHTCTV